MLKSADPDKGASIKIFSYGSTLFAKVNIMSEIDNYSSVCSTVAHTLLLHHPSYPQKFF
jgi:hypothetical protein